MSPNYLKRISDEKLKLYLRAKGAVLIEGPKWCGKTSSAEEVAGSVLYIYKQIVHVQYISANYEGKELGALDLLFDFLINTQYKEYDYFDFGQSTEQMGNFLNGNLLFQKEGFGGRGVIYPIYEIKI